MCPGKRSRGPRCHAELKRFRDWERNQKDFGKQLRSLPKEDQDYIIKSSIKKLANMNSRAPETVEIIKEDPPKPKMRRTK